jgi:hypothetical protein
MDQKQIVDYWASEAEIRKINEVFTWLKSILL